MVASALLFAASRCARGRAIIAEQPVDTTPSCGSELELPLPLPASALEQLERDGFCIVPRWLPARTTDALLADALALERAGLSRGAAVGSQQSGDEKRRMNDDVRRSSLCWLYPPPPTSAGQVDTRAVLYSAMHALRRQLDATDLLSIDPLAPFSTEVRAALRRLPQTPTRRLTACYPGRAASPAAPRAQSRR